MEKEFSVTGGFSSCLAAETKGLARKLIAVCISLLLLLQIVLAGLQYAGVQVAYAAMLPQGLVYKYAYGVRSDGISCFRNNGYDGVIVNSSGKVVFKEVYEDRTYTYTNADGKQESYTYKEAVLVTRGQVMSSDYLDGNIMIYKQVYDPHEESYSGPGGNGNGTITVDYRSYYGLLDPRTGEYVLEPNKTYDEVKAYCKSRGWNTHAPEYGDLEWKLPNGAVVEINDEEVDGKWTWYYAIDGVVAKVAGYELGNIKAELNDHENVMKFFCALSRTGVADGNLYYVHNNSGKVGAVNDKGDILIPFEYDAYYDTGAGSNYTLLKKNGAWQYFDLSTIKSASQNTTPSASQAGRWVSGTKGWWYRYNDGSFATGMQKIGNATYYFDNNGWMKTGWQKINNVWYYFMTSGAMATGWQYLNRSWYLMGSDGKMLTGWQTVSGKRYYLSPSGAMKVGWLQEGNDWYYLTSTGAMATGWQWVGRSWYYMGSDGKMLTGWQTIKGVRYYLSPSGAMYVGWFRDGGTWYYLTYSGAMATGWHHVSGTWYYMDADGRMLTGWQTIGGHRYFLASSGAMCERGWVKDGNSWYYVGSSGAMVKGWQKVGGSWYYMGSDGKMLTGWQTIEGKRYFLTPSGAMATGWVKDGKDWRFCNGSGVMVVNCWAGNYWLDEEGKMSTGEWVDNGKYYVDVYGNWVPNMRR